MKKNLKSEKKETKITQIDKKELISLIGDITCEVYGVIGITLSKTNKNQIIILRKENYFEGINVIKSSGDKKDLDIHLIVAYGVKITEVVNEIRSRLYYFIKKQYGSIINKINICVEDFFEL